MPSTDRELEQRFDRRYAAIDAEIPPTPVFEPVTQGRVIGRRLRTVGFLAAVAVVAVVAGPLLNLPSIVQPLASQPAATPDAVGPSFIPIPNAPFPAEVDGFRVSTVAETLALMQSGGLDGKAIAVAGYYDAFYPSCPEPAQYIGPLERWCDAQSLADTPDDARLCTRTSAGSTCHQPSDTALQPFFMPETSGDLASVFTGYDTTDPLPMVLIGHTEDPRQWRCAELKQPECAHAFAVDRVAWALGHDLPVTAPAAYDQLTYAPLTPTSSVEGVMAAVGPLNTVIAAAAFKARDISSIDPRWVIGGDSIVWFVRATAGTDVTPVGSNGARGEFVRLIDDATGQVIDSKPLMIDRSFQPARVWQMATVHGVGCCGGDLFPFVSVESAAGTQVYVGQMTGSASGDGDTTTWGGGYGSNVLVLPAGTYTVNAWLASDVAGTLGTHQQECSLQLTVASVESLAFNADFPTGKTCTIEIGTAPTSGP